MTVRSGPNGVDGGIALTTRNGWRVERVQGPVGDLLARPWVDPLVRTVRFLCPDSPGVVLGSTQPHAVVDAEAAEEAGIEVVRRPSGGGAVLVEPRRLVWVEVAIGADDPLWQADVARAGIWLGRVWQAALVSLAVGALGPDTAGGGPGVAVAEATVRTEWSSLICFSGLGPGEVSVGGRKVVGVSQRRTRAGARFQCGALLATDPTSLPALLALDPPARARATDALADSTLGLGEFGVTVPDLEAALLEALPGVLGELAQTPVPFRRGESG